MRNHESGCRITIKITVYSTKSRTVIFYCLCSNQQMMINKATFMIVTPTNPKKSRYVISNKATSTILTTPIYQSHNQSCGGFCNIEK